MGKKTVAIIGAGASGLPAIKSCLEEGLEPVCFELQKNVGGLWNYEEGDLPDRATVFRGVVMNSSKEMSAYSDFPAPLEFATFMPHHQFAEYFQMYAENFQLLPHIRFNHKVISIKPDPDASEKWVIEVQDLKEKSTNITTFDFVLVCSGHHGVPNWPSFPGQDTFQGEQLHSQQYRKPEKFENKRILVVGFGNSACDIAAECSAVSNNVFLSSRTHSWILRRQVLNGRPWDSYILTRWNVLVSKFRMKSPICACYEKLSTERFEHHFYGIQPPRRLNYQYPVLNDVISNHLLTGKVRLATKVQSMTYDSVVFEDGLKEKFDVIIYATGFERKCPMIEPVLDLEEEVTKSYHLMFPLKLHPKSSLAFIGLVNSNASSCVLVFELQSRYAVRIFSGQCALPSLETMQKSTKKHNEMVAEVLGKGHRLPTYIDAVPYIDHLAKEVGCNLRMWQIFFTDQTLFWACLTGPYVATQLRVHGPHAWTGARKAILSVVDNIGFHMRHAKVQKKPSSRFSWIKKLTVLSALGLAAYGFTACKASSFRTPTWNLGIK